MSANWKNFESLYLYDASLDFAVDVSRMDLDPKLLRKYEPKFKSAFTDMKKLDKGAVANPDENRKVGHYWLRAPELAPDKETRDMIKSALGKVKSFSKKILGGTIKGKQGKFENLLLIGIGGSALGPQFIEQALGPATKGLKAHFFDNTDPDGMDRTLGELKGQLGKTLSLVISKSGGTKETRNGMLEASRAYKQAKLNFADHAVAITCDGSALDQVAQKEGWIETFPMWDWVGGRTSVTSAVGLLPAALCGHDIDQMLAGAAEMDAWNRNPKLAKNPAGLLAVCWHHAGNGKGEKDMVVLPYKDRLELFSKYLQQLVMESLGKELDLNGKTVNQGLAVYGNKGSTDQHAYIQQLREGLHNFFVTFIDVKKYRKGASFQVEEGATTGDFLEGFYLGTREALYEKGRQSITLTVGDVSARTVGQLIALFDRAVGLYASMVNINAYHQPGVEAGKKAAGRILEIKKAVVEYLKSSKKTATALAISKDIGMNDETETVFKLLEVLSANKGSGVVKAKEAGTKSTYKAGK